MLLEDSELRNFKETASFFKKLGLSEFIIHEKETKFLTKKNQVSSRNLVSLFREVGG